MKCSAIFRLAALCAAILFIFQSCQKRNTGKNCLAFINADTLHFNLVDKSTGEDLFFSDMPLHTTNQVYFLIDDMTGHIKPKVETSTSGEKYFSLAVGTGLKNGMIKGYIDDQLAYTIDYSMKEDRSLGCPQFIFDKIVVNGSQREENIKGRIILLKK